MIEWLTENLESIFSYLLSFISFYVAYKQYKEKKLLEGLYKSNAWILYQRINNLGATIQKAFYYSNKNEIEKSLYEMIVRSDAISAELLKEGIRLVLLAEENTTPEIIDNWVKAGRLSEGETILFKKYCSSDSKK